MESSTERKLYDQEIHIVSVLEADRKAETISPDFVAEAVAFLLKDGIVVLDNVIDTAHLDMLNEAMCKDAVKVAEDPYHHFNFGRQTGNTDQAPPPTKQLMFKDIWYNPFAAAVLSAVLGPKPTIHYANGNTALKASGRQPVHSDLDLNHPIYFPFAYAINISLVDTSPENGATEIWVGSHHVSTNEEHIGSETGGLIIRASCREERRKHSPPIQATTKKGSLIIRDLRLWHAGMPNKANEPRIMLAFVVQPSWYQAKSSVLLPENVREHVEGWGDEMPIKAKWIQEEVDHLNLNSVDLDLGSNSPVFRNYGDAMARRPGYAPRWY